MKGLGAWLRLALWPLAACGSVLGFVAAFESGYAELSLYLVPAGIIGALFALEFWMPERPGRGTWGDPQVWNDLAHGVLGQAGGSALGQATFVFAAALVAAELSRRFGAALWPAHWPLSLQILVAVFVADGLDYWRHRLEHAVSWLWPIHALHHDIDRLSVLKSGRGHFLDMLVRALVVYAPLALVGAPREAMLAYAAAVIVFGPIAHANVSLHVPAWLDRIVLTPRVHHIHHARPLALSCRNYANVFPVWDLIFGTFEDPARHGQLEYGVEGPPQPQGVFGQIWAPFAEWWSGVGPATRTPPQASTPTG